MAQQEDKTAIFEEWCSFLNFFDSSIKFELSFVNMATDSTEFEKIPSFFKEKKSFNKSPLPIIEALPKIVFSNAGS